jgi:crotonobetainyl-CoA hydratase
VLGAGFGLATCADIIVDSGNALFGLAEAKGGIMDEFGGMHRAIQQTPCRVSLAMIPIGESLAADDAFRLGLNDKVVEFFTCRRRRGSAWRKTR